MLNSKSNRIVLIVSAVFIVALVAYALLRDRAVLSSLRDVESMVQNKQVTKVIASEKYTYIKTSKGLYKISNAQISPNLFSDFKVEVSRGSDIIWFLLAFVIFLGAGSMGIRQWLKYRQTSQPEMHRVSTADMGLSEKVTQTTSDVTFSDIGGISDVKEELEEIIDFLKNPLRYRSFGARMPRGVLLIGPPGVGKTMIAKAVAAEADVPFYYQSGASFVQIYVGMGAKRVHDLFSAAKQNSPAIIFIDEIDAVGKKRGGSHNDEREATLNQLLTEMDGFEDASGVIVVAATNKIEVLDAALLRAGRFDRRIFVELPTPTERESILSKYLKHIPNDVQSADIAKMTVGFNGASLAALVNEAALLSLRKRDKQVTLDHFYEVKDKVAFGKKKLPILSEEQKRYRARYLAGKAIVAYWFDLPFEKVMLSSESIKPPMTEPLLQHEIEARIKVLLGGMAASQLRFNEHASNAAADIAEAKELVASMLERYAMGETLISAPSDQLKLFERLYMETKTMLQGMGPALDEIEAILIESESISKARIEERVNALL
ncbi:MAG: ATP-dependent metallopeptidase FtsH/Yme1/Tma family protein [Epsilonproteobacteria bacterium]|nr:MAG: ATP-dependent metallopeptidase FtsH/Yme1/Tma family protein [Campylobacterota bacterium]